MHVHTIFKRRNFFKTRFAIFYAFLSLTCFFGGAIQAQTFIEENGLVVMEVESVPLVGTWESRTLISGYSGTSYYHAMNDYFSAGGNHILNYKFTLATSGIYQVQVRSRIAEGTTSTDFNDTWLRLVDNNGSPKTPVANSNTATGTWYKYYMNVKNAWTWNTSNRDNDPKSLSWDLPAGTYSFQLSMRSKGHAVDKIVLWNKSKYTISDIRGQATSISTIDALPLSKTNIPSDIKNMVIANNIVYPNPCSDYVNISNVKEKKTLSLYNTLGIKQIVNIDESSNGNIKLSIASIKPGIYFISADGLLIKILKK